MRDQHAVPLLPPLEECGVFCIEEPCPPDAIRDYTLLSAPSNVPIAAGATHVLPYQSRQLLEGEAAQVLQPDASKAGGITETKNIADLAAAFRRPFTPHTSTSGINSAATSALLATCSNGLIYGPTCQHSTRFVTSWSTHAHRSVRMAASSRSMVPASG
jgi:L-alanine-DL-glutamate epimerase-like enolase superfamily enzyme